MHYRKLAENPSINNRMQTLEKELLTDKSKLKVKDKYNNTLLAELENNIRMNLSMLKVQLS